MKKERITPALLKAVYSSYRNQRRIMNELNRKLSAASTKDEWISIYQERAATIRAAYAVNSETMPFLDIKWIMITLSYSFRKIKLSTLTVKEMYFSDAPYLKNSWTIIVSTTI